MWCTGRALAGVDVDAVACAGKGFAYHHLCLLCVPALRLLHRLCDRLLLQRLRDLLLLLWCSLVGCACARVRRAGLAS